MDVGINRKVLRGSWLVSIALLLASSAQRVEAQGCPKCFGTTGDIRVNADFDGDGNLDYAMWRPANGTWYVYESSNPATLLQTQWGQPGDVPVPGDYDADKHTDYAVWRPSTGSWLIELSSGGTINQQFGQIGDIPVPADYDGDGKTDMAVYRPSNGTFYLLLSSSNAQLTKQVGQFYDSPFTGDFDDDGKTDIAIYRPSNGTFYWWSASSNWTTETQVPLGTSSSDTPFVGDFDADGKTDFAVWRAYDPTITGWAGYHPGGNLHVIYSTDGTDHSYQSVPPNRLFATNFKVPGFDSTKTRVYNRVQGDFDGDGDPDFALFDPQNGVWFVVPSKTPGSPIQVPWCSTTGGDIPVAADYFGDGHTDYACWRPSTAYWYITSQSDLSSLQLNVNTYIYQFGAPGVDIPQPGDYDGDGKADLALFRPGLAVWYIDTSRSGYDFNSQIQKQWGLPGDIPVAADYDGDKNTDYAVFRPGLAVWYVFPSSSPTTPLAAQWGLPIGDQPVVGDFNGDGKADFVIWRPFNGLMYGLSATGSPSSTLAIGVGGNSVLLNDPPLTSSFGDFNFGF